MDILVIPVVDDVSGSEESVTKDVELCKWLAINLALRFSVLLERTIIGEGTDNTGAGGQVPDEVVVGDVDDGLAEVEVDGALGVANSAVNLVQVGARDGLSGGEDGDKLVEHVGGESAQGVAAVKQDSEAVGLLEDGVLGAIILSEADTVEVDPESRACKLRMRLECFKRRTG